MRRPNPNRSTQLTLAGDNTDIAGYPPQTRAPGGGSNLRSSHPCVRGRAGSLLAPAPVPIRSLGESGRERSCKGMTRRLNPQATPRPTGSRPAAAPTYTVLLSGCDRHAEAVGATDFRGRRRRRVPPRAGHRSGARGDLDGVAGVAAGWMSDTGGGRDASVGPRVEHGGRRRLGRRIRLTLRPGISCTAGVQRRLVTGAELQPTRTATSDSTKAVASRRSAVIASPSYDRG
jgi:hypothetical protein